MAWPNDVDGDVFRRLDSLNFDFSATHSIDFNIDFDEWPAPDEAIDLLINLYPNLEIVEPDEEDIEEGNYLGYILITLRAKLTYELVVNMQTELSNLVEKYNGICNSWGVLTDRPGLNS